MNILIVEDDDYKLSRIKSFTIEEVVSASITACGSLKEALEIISKNMYDLVFIDMAIPSHPTIAGQGTSVQFNTGGLEVIMELAAMGRADLCVIITQYPDIEISGEYIPISLVKKRLPALLECDVLACILYDDTTNWQVELKKVFEGIL